MIPFQPFRPNKPDSRYIKPKICRELSDRMLKYKNAQELARDIKFNEYSRFYVIVDGTFIFGDFIEAFFREQNVIAKKMTISTLSLSVENVGSLHNLLSGGYIQELNLIVSDYWYQNEKHQLVRHLYERLDQFGDNFQLAAASVHTKICIFETVNNRKFVFHGSANLRSSSNVEQIMLEENESLFNFNDEIHDSIIETYKTINKSVRRKNLWQAVVTAKEKPKTLENTGQQGQKTENQSMTDHQETQPFNSKPEKIKIERFKF